MKVTFEFELGKDPKKDALILELLGVKTAAAAKTKATKPAAEEAEEEAEADEEENMMEEEETDDAPTMEAVREAAQKLISGGKSASLKKILEKLKAPKVANIKKDDFAKFLEEAKKVK